MYGQLTFVDEEGEESTVYVIEETVINNTGYLLVTDSDDEDAEEVEVYILKDISDKESEEANYIVVEDDTELEYVSKIFTELIDDAKIEK